MGLKYLIDTNTVIEYLNNTLPHNAASLIEKTDSHISVITRMEMLAWPKATLLHIQYLQSFINASVVFNLEEPIILKAIEIRKNYRVKLPDSIVAGTAVVYNLALITRNRVDFEKIEGLKVIDPYSL